MARIVTRSEGEATAFKLDPEGHAHDQPSINVATRRSNLRRRIQRQRERTAAALQPPSSADDESSEQGSDGEFGQAPDPFANTEPGRGFEDFANSAKVSPPGANDPSSSDESSMGGYGGPSPPLHNQHNPNPMEVPRAPFATIEDEKQDILMKFKRLREKNIKLSQAYGPHSSLSDLRAEYDMLKRNAEMEGSVKFQRRALIAICSGLEWANKKFDPFNLELNGWSETIAEDIESFDPTFEKLHAKYSGKASLPPEAELMLSLAGSAFTFHLSNQFFKAAMPNMGLGSKDGDGPGKPNQATMASIFEKLQKEMAQPQQTQQPQPPQPPEPRAPPLVVPTNFMAPPVNTSSDRIREISEDSDSDISVTTSVATSVPASEPESTKIISMESKGAAGRGGGRGRGRGRGGARTAKA